jgi:hypothetical protein
MRPPFCVYGLRKKTKIGYEMNIWIIAPVFVSYLGDNAWCLSFLWGWLSHVRLFILDKHKFCVQSWRQSYGTSFPAPDAPITRGSNRRRTIKKRKWIPWFLNRPWILRNRCTGGLGGADVHGLDLISPSLTRNPSSWRETDDKPICSAKLSAIQTKMKNSKMQQECPPRE